MRKLVSSGSPYEPKVGISRAVRVGVIVTVAGTAPLGPDGRTVGKGDPAVQARRCLEIIAAALEAAGASLRHVVRTRILLTRIEDWQAVAGVHGEFSRDIRPANTIMQVSRFIDPDWLLEIEADAVVDDDGGLTTKDRGDLQGRFYPVWTFDRGPASYMRC
jgi:enamine deaminase RidA (YjgF/YER057c/UK114 family)